MAPRGGEKQIKSSNQTSRNISFYSILVGNKSTLNVRAAVGPLFADSGRMLLWNVHSVAAEHVAGGDGSLWQIAVGGMCAAHWPFVEHEPEGNKDSIDTRSIPPKNDFIDSESDCWSSEAVASLSVVVVEFGLKLKC